MQYYIPIKNDTLSRDEKIKEDQVTSIARFLLSEWERMTHQPSGGDIFLFERCRLKRKMGRRFLPSHLVDTSIDVGKGTFTIQYCPSWVLKEEKAPYGSMRGKMNLSFDHVRWSPFSNYTSENGESDGESDGDTSSSPDSEGSGEDQEDEERVGKSRNVNVVY